MSQILLQVQKLRPQTSCVRRSPSVWPAQRWCPALVSLLDSTGISNISRSKHWEATTRSSGLRSGRPSVSQTSTMDSTSPATPVILWKAPSKLQRKQRLSTFPVSVSGSTSRQQRLFSFCPLWCLFLVSLDGPKDTAVSIRPEGSLLAGTWVTLNCSSRAKPPIRKFTWFRSSQDGREAKINGSRGPTYSFNLTEEAVYRCEASNGLGTESSSIELTIQGNCADCSALDKMNYQSNEWTLNRWRRGRRLAHFNIWHRFLSNERGTDTDLSVGDTVIYHQVQLACRYEWLRDFSPRLSGFATQEVTILITDTQLLAASAHETFVRQRSIAAGRESGSL